MTHLTADLMAKPAARPSPGKRTLRTWALVIVVLALAVPFLPEVLRVTLGSNFHTVVDRRCYRAAQPSGDSLEAYIHQYAIRTVINLRGPNPGEDWFDEEEQAARRCGVTFVSVNLSASHKPQEQEVRNLVDTFDQCPLPILVHCNSGSDRSGFASACFLLLKSNATLEEARAQLSLRFGHFSWSRAGCQSQILDTYQEWLESQDLVHRPDHFRHWARAIYVKDDWVE
jgi:protein tyrosine phosphatase (PTP) superfamily phosphohydrolase (DUF442 family)